MAKKRIVISMQIDESTESALHALFHKTMKSILDDDVGSRLKGLKKEFYTYLLQKGMEAFDEQEFTDLLIFKNS